MLKSDLHHVPAYMPMHMRSPMPTPAPTRIHAAPLSGQVTHEDVDHLDWDLLLTAVKARLQQAVEMALARRGETAALTALAHTGATVSECAQALDRLHHALSHERQSRQQLEGELYQARLLLEHAHVELLGTRDDERRARHQALHDSLTGLPNRRYFLERLAHGLQHLDEQRPALAVFYLDLDGFKLINDQHGHETGDEVLKVVSARLARLVRAEDMLSRLGGDEFACLRVGHLQPEALMQFARKLVDAVAAPLQIGSHLFTLHVSVGISMAGNCGDSSGAIVKRADLAMYEAKRRQSGGCVLLHEDGLIID